MKTRILLALVMGVLLLLIGCDLPVPTCAPADLVAPTLDSPASIAWVGSLTPTFTWTYPDSCNPDGYAIYVLSAPSGYTDDYGGSVTGPTGTWTPITALETGTMYMWKVAAVSGGVEGPLSSARRIITGPVCNSAGLLPPTPLFPADGAVLDYQNPWLTWDYPDSCIPEGYHVQMAIDPAFATMEYDFSYDVYPFSNVVNPDLDNCSTHYWRIAPIVDAVEGPFSAAFSFTIDLAGTCAIVPQMDISGYVWHDACGVPELGPLPDPLPLGCIPSGGGGVIADGIRSPFEEGIQNVVVRLGSGPCPATNLGAVMTNVIGQYYFLELDPGTYCVSVDALEPNNVSALVPGGWSAPVGGIVGELASWEVTIAESSPASDVNFGWDFQFSGFQYFTTINGMVWHDLCSVAPGTDPLPSPLPDGCIVDDFGVVHADGIRQPSEPGIAGVVVGIGQGDCPSYDQLTATTDVNGEYTFIVPGDQNYCLRINAEGDPNGSILLPGRWTFEPSGHMGYTFRSLYAPMGGILEDVDFGWDYDNLPLTFEFPFFLLEQSAFCRFGPSQLYEMLTAGETGMELPIEGRNQDSSWLAVRLFGIRCWMARSSGRVLGDLEVVPYLAAPALPTPTSTPVVNCSQYTSPSACSAYPACEWVTSQTRASFCRNR
ncbi:MAG: hypothetical protein ABIJ39_00785 [Chloroflexota bacterium]